MIITEKILKMTESKEVLYRLAYETDFYSLEVIPYEIIDFHDGLNKVVRKIPFFNGIRKENIKKATRSVQLDNELKDLVEKIVADKMKSN